MRAISNFLTSRWGPILTGVVVGVLAPLLVRLGNPGNMGICVACFNRDIAGALGLHRADIVCDGDYFEPNTASQRLQDLNAPAALTPLPQVRWFGYTARGPADRKNPGRSPGRCLCLPAISKSSCSSSGRLSSVTFLHRREGFPLAFA